VNAWIFFRISGGLFNPAVTLGMCLIGAVNWTRGVVALISQILGAIAAAAVVSALFPGPLGVRTTLTPGTSVVRGLFIEMFLTAELVFCIFMLAAEKHKATFLAPVGIGISLFISELAGVAFTGGSLNPARSFGPDVVLGHFDGYHWIYWVGPFLGALVAVIFYRLVKVLEYETANPGQDFNDREMEQFNPDDEPATAEDIRRPIPGENRGYSESKKNGSAEKPRSKEKPKNHNSQHSPRTSHNSQNHAQGRDFGLQTGSQDRRTDGTDDTPRQSSYDAGHRSSNRNIPVSYNTKPEMAHISPHNGRHSRSNTRSSDERNADAYANAARAVYPPHGGDGSYSERASNHHQSQSRAYAHGPDAESGSAGFSDDTRS